LIGVKIATVSSFGIAAMLVLLVKGSYTYTKMGSHQCHDTHKNLRENISKASVLKLIILNVSDHIYMCVCVFVCVQVLTTKTNVKKVKLCL
jgi:hypothetical protein